MKDSLWNPLKYADPKAAALIKQAQSTPAGAEQDALFKQLDAYTVDQAWNVPWTQVQNAYVTAKDVEVDAVRVRAGAAHLQLQAGRLASDRGPAPRAGPSARRHAEETRGATMVGFLVRRLAAGIVLIFVVSALMFALMSATGSDPARNIVGQTATQEQVDAKAAELGLDQPAGHALRRLARQRRHAAISGTSWFGGDPVTTQLKDKLPVTLSIVLAGLLALGRRERRAGRRRRRAPGLARQRACRCSRSSASRSRASSSPCCSRCSSRVKWGWLPATGYVTFAESPTGWLESITLPALALAVGAIGRDRAAGPRLDDRRAADGLRPHAAQPRAERAQPALQARAAQRGAAGADGALAAVHRARRRRAWWSRRCSASTASASQVALGRRPGRRCPSCMGVVVVMVLLVVVVNLIMDVLYGWLNPKVRV